MAEIEPVAQKVVFRALLPIAALVVLSAIPFWLPWPALDSFLRDPSGARITDSAGRLLSLVAGRNGDFRETYSFDEIPETCRELFVKLEDERFFSHPGVDPLAVVRALDSLILGGPRSGASTITMQLARIVSPHPRSLAGKVLEAFRALQIESRLPKDRILTLYLNSVPFGRNARGVGAAAWTYFGADLDSLTPTQLLVLGIIPRNPTFYDPFDHPGEVVAAAREASASHGLGIGVQEIRDAVRSVHSARPPVMAPHFDRFVTHRLRQGLLSAPGGILQTTLDAGLNAFIEERVRFYLDRYASARVTNAAVVAIDNATGSVVG
ncbi:MAG TPA: transglycosylase domain-containing protein, partial [Spirochaetia bacterium]|nr:transglycosylase domain-containing protein [Spirochaetia bacterium]